MQDALRQAKLTADPLAMGLLGPEFVGLAYPAVFGLLMPDLVGPVVLIRRKVYPEEPGDWHVAGTAHPDDTEVQNGDGITHAASTGWEYAAARMHGNGFCGDFSEPVRIDFDGAGDLISPALPTWPRNVRAEAGAGGTFIVRWEYVPAGEGEAPTDFAVYVGNTPATIDYNTPLGTVSYDATTEEYEYETGAYGDGTEKAFAVRARNSDTVAEKNEFTTLTRRAEAGTPPAATIQSAKVREAGG